MTSLKATRSSQSWLTPDQKDEILRRYAAGESSRQIAPDLGCSDRTVSRVVAAAGALRDASARSLLCARPRAACGTPSGYSRHRRLGETACNDCKAANAAASRARTAKRREETAS